MIFALATKNIILGGPISGVRVLVCFSFQSDREVHGSNLGEDTQVDTEEYLQLNMPYRPKP